MAALRLCGITQKVVVVRQAAGRIATTPAADCSNAKRASQVWLGYQTALDSTRRLHRLQGLREAGQ